MIANANMATSSAPIFPAISVQTRLHGTTVKTVAMRQTKAKAPNNCGPRPAIVAQLQQEKVFNRRHDHLERCLEAEGAAFELALSPPPQSRDGAALLRVVYQGNPGGYGHAVVADAYGAAAEAVPCREMEGVFKAVETWVADAALIPIQNSLDGSIHRNYDLLLRHQLHIVGEVSWHVNHCLLAHPNTSISNLRRVIGHPQALSHCCETLTALGLRAEEEEEEEDIAHSALLVTSTLDTALVASLQAAHVYGLQIIRRGIQDDSHNITRFLQLARQPLPPPCSQTPCKTTIAFALHNGPADLFKAMSAFALRNIRVTNLESRPAPVPTPQQQLLQRQEEQETGLLAGLFKYMFVADIEASIASTHTQRALRQVEELSSFYRVLGSYAL